ncbi:YihY/virulence factor BrkB family protein [Legionella rowbothamii]|uniref:YihY/virulence factor BrkB family protein n=1 Tax=Legionella rowbothamii TaxID=96229 RepID=UPI001055FD64|nr:YihY/virulence factor BrkB family protein [Legionella rowbothamii]
MKIVIILKFSLINEVLKNWRRDRISSLAAALAYYTLFSLAPLLLICISITGTLFGEEAARGQIFGQLNSFLGEQTALQVQEMIQNVNQPSTALIARIFGILLLLLSASRAFSAIQEGLNIIWGVQPSAKRNWFDALKQRVVPFTMVFIFALLLFVSLAVSAFLAILSSHMTHFMGINIYLELLVSYLCSFLFVTLLFALMFKNLPGVELRWENIWGGALITALMFNLGIIIIGFYLNKAHLDSAFGAASSIIVLLIWVHYSAQIFFIGAEITKIYAEEKAG